MITDLLSNVFRRNFSGRKIDFAFLIHPRYTADIYRKYKFLKFLPEFLVNLGLFFFWPTYGGTIKGMTRDGRPIYGGLIIVPLPSKQMLRYRSRSKNSVKSAVRLASIYGAEIVGLGALTSSVTGGGEDIREVSKPTHLTSGNSLTAFITANDVISKVRKDNLKGPIAIIGATGSIGQAVSELLYEELQNEIIVIGKNPERTKKVAQTLIEKNIHGKVTPKASTSILDVQSAEVLVVTTSAHDATIHSDIVSNTKVIYDVTQPKNTPEEIQNDFNLTFIDGGLIKLPEEIHFTLDIGLPRGIAYSCLSETIILAASERFDLISSSKLKSENMRTIGELAHKFNFKSHQIITEHGHNI